MATFKAPASPPKSVMMFDTFMGCDFTNNPANVEKIQSPSCINLIRDVPGKVRKCMGYETIKTYDGAINGFHYIYGHEDGVVHAGEKLYQGDEVLYDKMANTRSQSWEFDGKLYIIDGTQMVVYDGETVKPITEVAKIPTITISKNPDGGGESYEALNLLQPGFKELFLGTEEDTEYQLTFGELDETKVEVQILDENGNWVDKEEETDFTVDRENGIITFLEAPGKSPRTGEDNISITAYRTVEGYADRINKCSLGTLYGVSGASDRLFLSGNPDYINYDWYSDQYDPTFFPDTAYGVIGTSRSAIVGYSVINNYLATHKDEMEVDQSIVLRSGELIDDNPTFRVVNTMQGPGAIAKGSFAYLINEPLFLTRSGIYAVTTQDLTGERYSQNRSFYLDGKLLSEGGLENSIACVYNDMYWLVVNDVAYILDGIQSLSPNANAPYSTRQYVGFYRNNLPANCMWTQHNRLFFGTKDGRICRFFNDATSQNSYNDDGKPIEAIWETPDLDGKIFYKKKTFRHLALSVPYAIKSTVEIFVQKFGVWTHFKDFFVNGSYFSFSNLDFEDFTFNCDITEKLVSTKIRVKKVDKARFRFRNANVNEPFGLYELALEFVENGNYKGE